MSWNAGGFGAMTFPSADALAAWRKDKVSHAAWDDWFDDLIGTFRKDESVAKRLAALASGHAPGKFVIQHVTVNDLTVALDWHTHEDGFRDEAGDMAALVRSAATRRANGVFHFLGTAGAEGDFAYEVKLDGNGTSTAKALAGAALAKLYKGAGYRAFMDRVSAMIEAANPEIAKAAAKRRSGEPATATGGDLHARVIAALAGIADDKLAAAAARFPVSLPDGKRQVLAKKLFASAKAVRSLLEKATSEELRAVALWSLGELAPRVAMPFAFEVLSSPGASESMRAAALRVAGHADAAEADTALGHLLAVFTNAAKGFAEVLAAGDALGVLAHRDLAAQLANVLGQLAKRTTLPMSAASVLVNVIRDRELLAARAAVAAFACSKAPSGERRMAAEQVLKWGDEQLLRQLAEAITDSAIGALAGRAWLRVDHDRAYVLAAPVATQLKVDAARDAILHHVLEALADDAQDPVTPGKRLIDVEPRWIELCTASLAQIARKEQYLAYNALDVLKHAKPDAKLAARIEALLANPKWEPIHVAEVAVALGSKTWRKTIEKQLASTKDNNRRSSLELCLECYT